MTRLLMNALRTAVMATLLLVGAVIHSAAVCATSVSLTEGSSFAILWQVGSSATLGIGSTFRGNILALASITLGNGAAVDGRLLARSGTVTLNANVITVPGGGVTAVRPSTWSGVKALYR